MRMRRPHRAGSASAATAGLVLVLALSGFAIPASAGVPLRAGQPGTHVGTAGNDVLTGTAAADVFVGRAGDDRLIGRGGNDPFCAGPGDDLLDGGDGTDIANGGTGTDDCPAGETLQNCETPTSEFDVDGSWSGLTSQDKSTSFEVTDHALTTITIAYEWTGPGCTSESETTIEFGTPPEIVDNAFDIDSDIGTQGLQIHGDFTSDTAATGTFSVSDSGGFCPGSASGTWDAAKA